jgi:hypothetical protein
VKAALLVFLALAGCAPSRIFNPPQQHQAGPYAGIGE